MANLFGPEASDIWRERFDALWKQGSWRKLGRDASWKSFQRQIKTDEDWKLIQLAAREFNLSVEAGAREKAARDIKVDLRTASWIAHGSTFFGEGLREGKNWRRYIPEDIVEIEERAESLEGESCVKWCIDCQPHHMWTCSDSLHLHPDGRQWPCSAQRRAKEAQKVGAH